MHQKFQNIIIHSVHKLPRCVMKLGYINKIYRLTLHIKNVIVVTLTVHGYGVFRRSRLQKLENTYLLNIDTIFHLTAHIFTTFMQY